MLARTWRYWKKNIRFDYLISIPTSSLQELHKICILIHVTFQQFKQLLPTLQELAVWYKGEPIACRTDNTHFYQLVQVDAFYIEIVYETYFNTIKGMFAFDDIDLLDPYLNDIALDLFKP